MMNSFDYMVRRVKVSVSAMAGARARPQGEAVMIKSLD